MSVAEIRMPAPTLSRAVRSFLLTEVRAAAEDTDVRAILLLGSGRAFCLGQDLSEHAVALRADADHAVDSLNSEYAPLILALNQAAKPVVVAVNGLCAGGGIGLALAGDVRIAAADARFVTAFSRIGLAPDCGLSVSLAHAIGRDRALALLLTGATFTADEARSWGMVADVVDRSELEAVARAQAAALAEAPTLGLAATKWLLRSNAGADLAGALDCEYGEQRALARSADHHEAVEAFVHKRVAQFRGV